jgi:hypothetical protein
VILRAIVGRSLWNLTIERVLNSAAGLKSEERNMTKKIFLAGACMLALATSAIAQSSNTMSPSSPARRDGGANAVQTPNPNSAATTGNSIDAKRAIPGNNAVGGDGSQSNPKSTAPGAAKAGGG